MEYLGTIDVGAGAGKNNTAATTPFVIPKSARALYLQSDTAGVQFEIGVGNTFATSAAHGQFIPSAKTPVGPFPTKSGIASAMDFVLGNAVPAGATSAHQGGASQTAPTATGPVVAVWNPTGGAINVQVYAE